MLSFLCNSPRSSSIRIERTETDSLGYFAYIYSDSVLIGVGEYFDSSRQIPNGQFVFLYPNGRIAAKGKYSMGLKDGEWIRFDSLGKIMPLKIYNAEKVRKWNN